MDFYIPDERERSKNGGADGAEKGSWKILSACMIERPIVSGAGSSILWVSFVMAGDSVFFVFVSFFSDGGVGSPVLSVPRIFGEPKAPLMFLLFSKMGSLWVHPPHPSPKKKRNTK